MTCYVCNRDPFGYFDELDPREMHSRMQRGLCTYCGHNYQWPVPITREKTGPPLWSYLLGAVLGTAITWYFLGIWP